MCEPTTIALVAGLALSAGSAVYQADVTKKTGEANAKLQDRQAKDAVLRGEEAAAESRRRTQMRLGQQRSLLAASGVQLDKGTPSGILADTAEFGELEALTIRNNAQREGFYYRAGAEISRTTGRNAAVGGYMDAAGTLLTGAPTVSSEWQSYKQRRNKPTSSQALVN